MQLKQGEIHSTVFATAVLTGKEYALEVQINAYSLLQHLVRHSPSLYGPSTRNGSCMGLDAGGGGLPIAPWHMLQPRWIPPRTQVKHRWNELSEQEQQQVTQLAYQHLQDGAPGAGGSGAWRGRSQRAACHRR